jgi:L-threonylcarbamoyladenylate synthase
MSRWKAYKMGGWTILRSSPATDAVASGVLAKGGLLVFPTDTVYGLGCDPFDPAALRKLFSAKGRGTKAVPVLCDSVRGVQSLVTLKGKALKLARAYWPGALTVVAPLAREVPYQIHHGTGTLGVRIPGSTDCRRLIRACGGFLVGTSANLSGKPSSRSVAEAVGQLGSSVDLYIDGGELRGSESTVVKVAGDEIIILRKGSVGVSEKELRA